MNATAVGTGVVNFSRVSQRGRRAPLPGAAANGKQATHAGLITAAVANDRRGPARSQQNSICHSNSGAYSLLQTFAGACPERWSAHSDRVDSAHPERGSAVSSRVIPACRQRERRTAPWQSRRTVSSSSRRDPSGLRVRRVLPTRTDNLLNDDQNLVQIVTGDPVVYQHLPGIWGSLFSVRYSNASKIVVPDFQGHSRLMVNSSQAITETAIYDAWGAEVLNMTSGKLDFRSWGALGYFRDSPTRSYARARELRRDWGRWLSVVPIGFAGGDWNAYLYVSNAPVTAFDPSGMQYLCAPVPPKLYTKAAVEAASQVIEVKVWDHAHPNDCRFCSWVERTKKVRVRTSLVTEVKRMFKAIHDAPIESRVPIHTLGHFNWRCKQNNSCAGLYGFNECIRMMERAYWPGGSDGEKKWLKFFNKCASPHSQAMAFDINEDYNPMTSGPNPYLDCGRWPNVCCYAIPDEGVIVRAFDCWVWGGHWRQDTKDYMHFSKNGE